MEAAPLVQRKIRPCDPQIWYAVATVFNHRVHRDKIVCRVALFCDHGELMDEGAIRAHALRDFEAHWDTDQYGAFEDWELCTQCADIKKAWFSED